MARYRVGELDDRVTIFDIVETTDQYGQTTDTKQDLGTYWAHARPMSGQEREYAEQREGVADYLFIFRRCILTDITIRERGFLRWLGQDYNIRFIKDRGPRSEFLEIEAERGVQL
jgi:SPP1 family predicted phage head-tail adaptor